MGVEQQDDPPDTMHMVSKNPQLLFPDINGYHNIMHAMSDIQAEKLTIIYYLAM